MTAPLSGAFQVATVVTAQMAAAATAVTFDMNTIVLAVIGLIGTTITGVLALRMKEVHVAVNSSKTILENKVDDLIKRNMELTKQLATLEENKRGAELAKAVSDVKPVVVTPAAVMVGAPLPIAPVPAAPPPEPVTVATTITPAPGTSPLKEAIDDLTEAAKDTVTAADKTVEMVVKVPHK